MIDAAARSLSTPQQIALVILRTLIGWHFLYEGFYKWMLPAWGSDGKPIGKWSSAGYLNAAAGPLAGLFHRLVETGWVAWIDRAIVVGLILIGLSLLLGALTKAGCWGAIFLLALFYLSWPPLQGLPQQGSEGTYLLVNKNLIELVAVVVLLVFRTEWIAGLDLLWKRRKQHSRLVIAE
ncbi:MAG: DoxX subfamily [Acidobacteriota bacterium]|nr:DoxX subfamily [Acidobacteriota bacterium]